MPRPSLRPERGPGRTPPLWLLLPALGACRPDFANVDEACKDKIKGESHASSVSGEFFQRLACYRRYAGVEQPRIDKKVTIATEAHVDWMNENLADATYWNVEDDGTPLFYGATVFDRLERAEFNLDTASSMVWEVLMPVTPERNRTENVDLLIHDPHYRDPLLAPGWYGGGYDETSGDNGGLAYSVWVLDMPSGTHSGKPVVWPVDGDVEVPPSVVVWKPGVTDIGEVALRGYPITLTFGSSEVLGVGRDNPLGVSVLSSTITADDGTAIEHEVEVPMTTAFGTNNSTAILWPAVELAPDTTYTVEVEVSWVTTPHKTLDWSFTTTSEPVTETLFSRGAPHRPSVLRAPWGPSDVREADGP